ncbi:hypothetical protein FBQ82_18600, partial [Anaerolineae bacterium CFX7]|nr:hypothetical protein [Anaerolineae bacterium CFX7]
MAYAYALDSDNLLTRETRYDAQNNVLVTYTFDYDETHNRTSETENAADGVHPTNQTALTTTYGFDDLNRNTSITDPYGATTGYIFDAAGNLIGQTDPAGLSTTITPNAVNQPAVTTIRDANQNLLTQTTNTFTNGELSAWTTDEPAHTLTLADTLHYNGNGYIDQKTIRHQGSASNARTSTLDYTANHLLQTFVQENQSDIHYIYDSAGRLVCSERGGSAFEYLKYDSSGRRTDRYWQMSVPCATIHADPAAFFLSHGHKHSVYTWEGYRLVGEQATMCSPGCGSFSSFYDRTFEYDADGNLHVVTHLDYDGGSAGT